jgi:hypothetical protein
MKNWIVALCLLLIPALGFAQTPNKKVGYPVPPSTYIGFDHDGINTETYGIIIDGGPRTVVNPVRLGPVAGSATLYEYEFPFPPMTPGLHTFTVDACNFAGCGVSDPFVVELVALPGRPSNLRLVIKSGS